MPPQSRSQRKRHAARQQRRPATAPSAGAVNRDPSAEAVSPAPSTGPTVPLAPVERAAPRPARQTRRVISRPPPEPVDYSKDYAAVRRDLRWIALWTVLMFAGMIALKVSGLV